MTRYIDDKDVASLLSQADAVHEVDKAFRLLADGRARNAPRQRSQMDNMVLNVMWAFAPTEGVAGVKAYPIVRTDVTQGAVLTLLLYSFTSGELLAVLKADRLGQLRTGAASAVATRALARDDAKVLTIYGTGFQAETQALAQAEVMVNLETVLVVGRHTGRRHSFIERLRQKLSVDVREAEPETAARSADVISTATGSADPVLMGNWLEPGTHINAVGSNNAEKREIDREVLERAGLIACDDLEVAAIDGGDFIANAWNQSSVTPLGDVLTGRALGRQNADEITIFESHGLALQDVVCAAHVLRKAAGVGIDGTS